MGTRMEVAQLESRMNTEDYRKLQDLFLDPSSGASRSLSRTEFIHLAWSSVGHGSKEEYGLLFDSVVVTQEHRGLLLDIEAVKEEGRVDWPGLCSFLLLELSDKVKNTRTSSVPCWKPPRTLTCPHRDPVKKVLHLQSSGQYLTVSKGGTVGLRNGEDMSLLHTHRLQNSTVTPKDLWVTDMVLLHNVHKIAVSFTSKEVCFYDILSKQDFSCKYKLQGLKFTPWCLDYWVDPSHSEQAVLTIGDIGGQVSGLYFTSAHISLFERLSLRTDSDSADIILWDELVKGKHRSCYTVTHQAHTPAWVRKVHYLGSLEAFVSCSTRPQSSMVISWREKESRTLRVTSFFTKRGVWDLDHHRGLNLIATAGVDHQVLLWNPYVTSEPVCVFSGHTSPVTAVCFMQTKQQLLSFSKDKVLCLWDVSSQLCVHRLAGVFPKTQEDTDTLLLLHEERQLLLLSFNSLLLLLETMKEEKRTSSHEHPVTCVLYNSLFRQVVSSDSASSVICWLADTGQKVKQFHRCHGNAEISTMALDGTQTRLFTAGTDGEVKVWDFNGRCLHRMNAGLGRAVEISQVLLLKRSILAMGWERMLTVFRLHSFSQSFVEPSEWKGGVQHRSDVLCATFQPPQTLVTGSYDGEIIVWNNSTEKALRKLRPHAEHREGKKQLGHFPDSHLGANGKEDSDNSIAITRLFFIPGRTPAAAATGGADLVSCGGSGVVRFWNTVHSHLVGQFTAHNGDLGSIVMTVSPCGKYLVTADREGTLKAWDIQHHCLEANNGITKEPPKLLRSFRPHLERVTHLEMCYHGERLLLLSSSSDCSVALSYPPGDTVGLFGQEEQWSLEGHGPLHPQQEQEQDQGDH
ncbi:WD repeat-containing protein 49-like isoform X1 [Dicentrarchus labrax]|uniref:WD repeat-containing protein 49-like isoform X1 n=1 Tax=Dicentrarchus labrax TaxID=13489 RepID=UPI0021F605E1|nr:WD repeat-containing protein 49-like isoform X1 [Dicentrarchus labrax]XP_051252811.1 WD repeat-containing protein 49-like isoform X1 [Dicentrarchus labrax]XP_051252812.1 WD repeat-containing protein 49-like isoform X1 [Dicentrarchus labrax]